MVSVHVISIPEHQIQIFKQNLHEEKRRSMTKYDKDMVNSQNPYEVPLVYHNPSMDSDEDMAKRNSDPRYPWIASVTDLLLIATTDPARTSTFAISG